MKIELIDHWGSEELIARVARLCHRNGWEQTKSEHTNKFITGLLKMEHYSPFEFAGATFLIENVPIYTARQMMRHRHLSFMERSLQYVQPDDQAATDPWIYTDIFWAYRMALEMGKSKREARRYLPLCTHSVFLASGNLRAWMEFIQKRTVSNAEPEIQEIARSIQTQLAELFPNAIIQQIFMSAKKEAKE